MPISLYAVTYPAKHFVNFTQHFRGYMFRPPVSDNMNISGHEPNMSKRNPAFCLICGWKKRNCAVMMSTEEIHI